MLEATTTTEVVSPLDQALTDTIEVGVVTVGEEALAAVAEEEEAAVVVVVVAEVATVWGVLTTGT